MLSKKIVENYPSNNKHAIALGINTSVYGYIDSGATEGKISDALLLSVSRRLGVSIRRETPWKVAEDPCICLHHRTVGVMPAKQLKRIVMRHS